MCMQAITCESLERLRSSGASWRSPSGSGIVFRVCVCNCATWELFSAAAESQNPGAGWRVGNPAPGFISCVSWREFLSLSVYRPPRPRRGGNNTPCLPGFGEERARNSR